MADLAFEPFQPRRIARRIVTPLARDVPYELPEPRPDLTEAPRSAAHDTVQDAPGTAVGSVDTHAVVQPRTDAQRETETEMGTDVRETACRIAALACARLLRGAFAADPTAIARLIDEGIALAGADIRAVRLNPQDAASLELGSLPLETDAALARGAVEIKSASGTVASDIDTRSALLAGWAADRD